MTKFLNISTDTTLGGNAPSDELAVSQKAIKTYVDTKQDTLTAGTGIDITNNTVSVTAPTVINTATGDGVLTILGTPTSELDAMNIGKGTSVSGSYSFCFGINSSAAGASSFCIGRNAKAYGSASMAMGLNAEANGNYTVAIGRLAKANTNNTIQIGYGTNTTAYTLGVGFYGNSSTYTLLDGTTGLIPTARLADTTSATQGRVLTLDSSLNAVWANSGGGGSVNIDNLTITENASNEIQAVATVNANTAAGATNPIYDWVGTLAEYQAQDIETDHPDWLCYITDDVSGGASVYTKAEVDAIFVAKGHQVIEFQEPTSSNGYTWYRKYDDGWVEQGGIAFAPVNRLVSLPVEMANTYYTAIVTPVSNQGFWPLAWANRSSSTTTAVYIDGYGNSGQSDRNIDVAWQVSGMAA